jgi:formate dehydrogenase beta subunit
MKLLTKMMHLQEQHGAVTDAMLREMSKEEGVPLYRLEGLRGFYPVFSATPRRKTQVQVCRDIVCMMKGGSQFCSKVKSALSGASDVEVEEVSCVGRCDTAPAATINEVPVSGSVETITAYATGKKPLPSNAPTTTPRRWPTDPYANEKEHYSVIKKFLKPGDDRQRDEVIKILKEADLRGLGGAAFPTGMKWDLTRKAVGRPKYVVCNADESEPGTFKDRVILEELPHLLIEAMVLAGWMIGAKEGIIYIRHEYGKEKKALQQAIEMARRFGALGKKILGSDTDFDLQIFVSPGGYIMGEETALLEALEDKRGEPRNKPPFPVDHGLWGKPTLMNNVETFAAIPIILERGAAWWVAQGKGNYKGLKYMCVSGDVAKPGVYCVPWGTTVDELLTLCGGVPDGKALYAFSPGGASTNFLPASKRGTALDFKAMQEAGSSLGTGAMVFMAEGRDVLELAISEVKFFRNESCGKCVPCRVGSHKAVDLVETALAGKQPPDLVALLQDLNSTLAQTSICGLGQVAMAPLMSVINYFPDDALPKLQGSIGQRK